MQVNPVLRYMGGTMELIDFIYVSNQAKTVDALVEHFVAYLKNFGLDRFIMSSMSHDHFQEKEKNHGVLVNFPEEWMQHYQENNYLVDDGIYNKALMARAPFTWKSVKEHPRTPDKSVRILDEAQEFKLYDGIGLSIHKPYGHIIGMGIAGSDKGVECSKDVLSLVFAAANQFYLVFDDLSGINNAPEPIRLTNRESEVLLWLARGKSIMDIADILSVSTATAKYHCLNIYRKLDVDNGRLAVMKAIRMGLIQPY